MSKKRLPPKEFLDSSAAFGANAIYIEELYQRYLENPSQVSETWRQYFASFDEPSKFEAERSLKGPSWSEYDNNKIVGFTGVGDEHWQDLFNSYAPKAKRSGKQSSADAEVADTDALRLIVGAKALINAYKEYGHLQADLDPLALRAPDAVPELDPAQYGFTEGDYDTPISLNGELGFSTATLNEIIAVLRKTYAHKLGVEFMHILSAEEREWVAERMESSRGNYHLTSAERRTLLKDLIEAEGFEQFVHRKFPGTKRFSVEGSESVIAAIELLLGTAAKSGISEVAIGMAHRGRLNVLTKIVKKPYVAMLSEFQGTPPYPTDTGISGDVKYHLGASSDREFEGCPMHISLMPNPSHLEAVNAVTVGKVRARQDVLGEGIHDWDKVMAVMLHGDASFAGQGVVTETLTLSKTEAYGTGGSVHVIINNQVGFTTDPEDARSSSYASDMAKGIQLPIFHVNGDEPDAVGHAIKMAYDFRKRFKKDVVLDIIGYRRYGHNENDEPLFTQPKMYKIIAKHPTTATIYAERLIAENVITREEVDQFKKSFKDFLESELEATKSYEPEADWLKRKWGDMTGYTSQLEDYETGIDEALLQKVGKAISNKPEHVNLNSKIARQLDAKANMVDSGQGIDWGTGEALAFGALLEEGSPIRFTGQDVRRGTFSHRHAVLTDQETGEAYTPLNNISDKQAQLSIFNSTLSEFAVLGFEYGYSMSGPEALVLWEAQFGDFVNGAQIIIDQFISSAQMKWLRLSGLVMLLPHGYEGQGPEHSSARLERFLQLCAEDNMQVANCSTPANYFHILRRQQKRNYRKPLIVVTPKSLLRHKLAVSSLDEFKTGSSFQPVISDTTGLKPAKARKVVICSGKVYYDLYEAREKQQVKDVAIIRLEEFYPFPEERLKEELTQYKHAEIIWCQEEPKNMGAWFFLEPLFEELLTHIKGAKCKRIKYAGRKAAASPAVGYMKMHVEEQNALINEALA